MSKLISLGIDATKIPRTALREDNKGRKWLNLSIWVEDTPDQYGNDVSCHIQQSKEEREAKTPKIYLGNGQKKFGWDDQPQAAAPKDSAPVNDDEDDADDLPF